jgi:hypothetical protein
MGEYLVASSNDALPYLVCQLLWVRNEHRACPLKVNVWVSSGSDTQSTKETHRFILVRASGPHVQQYSDLRVRNGQSGDYNGGNQKSLVENCLVLS